MKNVKGWLIDFVIAFGIVVIITTFFVQNFRVIGNSMEPTLENNHLVLIDKIVYVFTQPKKGDMIGFYDQRTGMKLIKRIIGEPGDVITYREGVLYVNENPVNNMNQIYAKDRGDIVYPYIVPENEYFVIGDNINNSIDSRYKEVGSINKEHIIGKVQIRVWPFWENPFLKYPKP